MKILHLATFALLTSVTLAASADTLYMKDGSTRNGTVVQRSPEAVQLRVDSDGMQAIVVFPMKNIARIDIAPPPHTPRLPPEKTSAKTKVPATAPKTMPSAELPHSGFLAELAATAVGHGPDDPARLPPKLRSLWKTAMDRDLLGNPHDTLDALRALDDAFSSITGGLQRLDGISRRERHGEAFGAWMARVHWELIGGQHFRAGQLDLSDVRDVERPALIGILKEQSVTALEPLKPYFPPIDAKTGKPRPFQPSQLQGINVSNALEVKREAVYARALLLGQLKLEPQMPVIDRILLGSQLRTVNKILAKAMEAEPAARAAAEKAAREKRISEEKARHGG